MKMHGSDIVGLGREGFLAIAPPFTGDILWEHLEILQKGKLTHIVISGKFLPLIQLSSFKIITLAKYFDSHKQKKTIIVYKLLYIGFLFITI